MMKRMLIMILVIFGAIVVLGLLKTRVVMSAMAEGKTHIPPPTAVSTIKVELADWQPVLSAVGTVKAVNGVTVSTDLAGIVSQIAFESGTAVKKGDLLVRMDTEQEEAQMRSNVARQDLAKLDVDRKRDLTSKKAIAPSELDTAESELRRATAAVEESKALISRKNILAPFDGVIGIRQVNLGQYLNTGAMIAPLQSMDPIYVEFALPQQHLGEVELGKVVRVTAGGLERNFEGKITAIDSRVDDSTRNITIQATVANPEHQLRPGMFANVEVLLPMKEQVIAIPSTAVSYASYGDSVYVVKPNVSPGAPSPLMVQPQIVKLGATRGDQVAVESGLKAGDEIVTSAVFKLRPAAPVRVNNETAHPSNDPAPHPEDT